MIARKPIILRSGGVSNPLDWVDRTAFALGANLFIGNSQYTMGALVAAGVPADRIRMVYHGVNPNDFHAGERGTAIRKELSIPQGAPVIATIGRLQRWKGQQVAIRSAQQVVSQFPNARFLIVGDALFGIEPEFPETLRALIRELNLIDHVIMLGNRTDIPAILAATDIVLVPSINPEPFGIVTIEAMAAGKPVVATDQGGSREILVHRITGLLVPPNDHRALGEAIAQLLVDPEGRDAMGARGREVVREQFSIERAVRQWQEAYLECLESA